MSSAAPHSALRCRVGSSAEVPEGGRLVVDIDDITVGVFRFKGELHAYENSCPHSGGPVCQGRLVGRVVEVLDEARRVVDAVFDTDELHIVCPWHGVEFSVRTGEHPAQKRFRLREYPVEEVDGAVYITL